MMNVDGRKLTEIADNGQTIKAEYDQKLLKTVRGSQR
jgi:hypothetical protein